MKPNSSLAKVQTFLHIQNLPNKKLVRQVHFNIYRCKPHFRLKVRKTLQFYCCGCAIIEPAQLTRICYVANGRKRCTCSLL